MKRKKKSFRRKGQLKKLHLPVFSRQELWGLKQTFAIYLAAGLKEFTSHEINGTPWRLGEKTDPENRITDETDFLSKQEWKDILQKMWYSFDQIANEYPEDPHNIWFNEHEKNIRFRLEKGTNRLIIEGDEIPEDIIKERSPAYYRKIQEGLNLFALYFQGIWD